MYNIHCTLMKLYPALRMYLLYTRHYIKYFIILLVTIFSRYNIVYRTLLFAIDIFYSEFESDFIYL